MGKVTGTLPRGLEFNGTTHREYAVRAQKVRDSVDAYDKPRARANDAYLGLCVLAAQVEKLGAIPKAKITAELLLDMDNADLNELQKAAQKAESASHSFRGQDDPAKEGNPGDA